MREGKFLYPMVVRTMHGNEERFFIGGWGRCDWSRAMGCNSVLVLRKVLRWSWLFVRSKRV